MGTIRNENGDLIDTGLAVEVIDLLQKQGLSPNDMILVLLTVLYEFARANDVSPEEAIEDYKEVFLSIERNTVQ